MAALAQAPKQPQLPGAGSVLSKNVPGAGFGSSRRPSRVTGGAGRPVLQEGQQPQQQPVQQEAPTFAQLQQSGRARPAPPTPPRTMMASRSASVGPSVGAGVPAPDLRSQLSDSLRAGLANPNPYSSDTVSSIDRALTGQLRQDYGNARYGLEEDLARRGLSASTFGGREYENLQDKENQALATMRAGLIQSAANAEAAARGQAQGAAQNFLNAENAQGLSEQQLALQRELGLGNLDISRGQLDLSRELGLGNLDLSRQDLAQRGSQFDRDFGLREQGMEDSREQFRSQLAQALGIAQMQDRTANRGIDTNASQQQLDFLLRMYPLLAGGGAGGSSGTGGGGTGGTGGGSSTYTGDPRTQGYGTYTDPVTQEWGDEPPISIMIDKWQEENPGQERIPSYTNGDLQRWWRERGDRGKRTTVNFGGKQYTPDEFEELKREHPELFGPQNPSGSSSNLAPTGGSSMSVQNSSPSMPAGWTDADRQTAFNNALEEARRGADAFAGGSGYFRGEEPPGLTSPADAQTRQDYINNLLRNSGFSPDGQWLGEPSNYNPNAIWWDDPENSPVDPNSPGAQDIWRTLTRPRPTSQQQPRQKIYLQNGRYTDQYGNPLTYRNGKYYDRYGRQVA